MGSGVVPPPWPPGRPKHGSVVRRQSLVAGHRRWLMAAVTADGADVCVWCDLLDECCGGFGLLSWRRALGE